MLNVSIPHRGFWSLLLAFLLSGCGFQLRGPVSLPPQMRITYVQTPASLTPPGSLSQQLPQALARGGVTVTRNPAEATATITIGRETSGRRTMAADRFDIKRQYFLTYEVIYRVTLANGQALTGDESMNATRTLVFDENRVLAFEEAQDIMIEDMARELTWQIVRRLEAIPPP